MVLFVRKTNRRVVRLERRPRDRPRRKTFPFMALPKELRFIVYEFILLPKDIEVTSRRSDNVPRRPEEVLFQLGLPAICVTSKQIFQESIPILLAGRNFRFWTLSDLCDFRLFLYKFHHDELRSLLYKVQSITLMPLAWQPTSMHWREYIRRRKEFRWNQALKSEHRSEARDFPDYFKRSLPHTETWDSLTLSRAYLNFQGHYFEKEYTSYDFPPPRRYWDKITKKGIPMDYVAFKMLSQFKGLEYLHLQIPKEEIMGHGAGEHFVYQLDCVLEKWQPEYLFELELPRLKRVTITTYFGYLMVGQHRRLLDFANLIMEWFMQKKEEYGVPWELEIKDGGLEGSPAWDLYAWDSGVLVPNACPIWQSPSYPVAELDD